MTAAWVETLGSSVSREIDVDSYFRRIGYTGSRAPTLETLQKIVFAHATAIPFENLDVLLSGVVSLNHSAVDKKILRDGRGGYCFEQNTLMMRALGALGFTVLPISSRVRVDRPPSAWACPRTHVLNLVTIEGVRWLADVGVGGLSASSVIRLDVTEEQSTPHEPRRVVLEGSVYLIQAKQGKDWKPVCDFTLEVMSAVDREVANWFTSTHPDSHFKNRLVVSRMLPHGRVNLLNHDLSFRNCQGEITSRLTISTREQLLQVLRDHFNLHFPAGTTIKCPGLQFAAPKL